MTSQWGYQLCYIFTLGYTQTALFSTGRRESSSVLPPTLNLLRIQLVVSCLKDAHLQFPTPSVRGVDRLHSCSPPCSRSYRSEGQAQCYQTTHSVLSFYNVLLTPSFIRTSHTRSHSVLLSQLWSSMFYASLLLFHLRSLCQFSCIHPCQVTCPFHPASHQSSC